MRRVSAVDQNESLETVRDIIEKRGRVATKYHPRLLTQGRDLVAELRCSLRPTEDHDDWVAGARFDVV